MALDYQTGSSPSAADFHGEHSGIRSTEPRALLEHFEYESQRSLWTGYDLGIIRNWELVHAPSSHMLTSLASASMMSVMPKKKGPKGPTQISMRLKPAELKPLDEDRKALPGVPVSRNTYAKHAVLSFPRLRKLEEEVRKQANGGEETVCDIASDFLREAGL